jgi:hypothetical protein
MTRNPSVEKLRPAENSLQATPDQLIRMVFMATQRSLFSSNIAAIETDA